MGARRRDQVKVHWKEPVSDPLLRGAGRCDCAEPGPKDLEVQEPTEAPDALRISRRVAAFLVFGLLLIGCGNGPGEAAPESPAAVTGLEECRRAASATDELIQALMTANEDVMAGFEERFRALVSLAKDCTPHLNGPGTSSVGDENEGPPEDQLIDPFEILAIRDCGCRVWWFTFDPLLSGIEPDEDEDPLEWFSVAAGTKGHAVRTIEAPTGSKGFQRFAGSRGPQGQRHIPKAVVVDRSLVLVGTNLCRHASRGLKVVKGRELHRWSTFAEQIRTAAATGIDPCSPLVEVHLVHRAPQDPEE